MTTMEGTREFSFRLRMSADERNMLEALAERTGLSASDIVRQHIRRAYAAEFGDKKPRPKK